MNGHETQARSAVTSFLKFVLRLAAFAALIAVTAAALKILFGLGITITLKL